MPKKYNTVFISDIHLGTDICDYETLLQFLKSFEDKRTGNYVIKKLYLVGDIIDMVNFNHKLFWSKHRTVIKKFLRMADKGVEIVYIPGNHDYFIREEILGDEDSKGEFNGISFQSLDIHTTVNGKRYLVLHGDEFDGIVKLHPFIYSLGDFAYKILLWINKWHSYIRKILGLKQWSLSLWLKTKTKNIIQYVNRFEELVVKEANDVNVDGVIAGHIHKAEDRKIDNIHYLNCGCWTEFCSAVVENENGELEVLYIKR